MINRIPGLRLLILHLTLCSLRNFSYFLKFLSSADFFQYQRFPYSKKKKDQARRFVVLYYYVHMLLYKNEIKFKVKGKNLFSKSFANFANVGIWTLDNRVPHLFKVSDLIHRFFLKL